LTSTSWYLFLFAWLFAVILWASFSVIRHADGLAILLGEPYGTLILTLSVIGIEVVMIAAVMLTGSNNPTLARDTMFSVLMIVLNGMVGMSLLIGAVRHHEQTYNLQGAKAYIGVLLPLAMLGLILPRLTASAPGGQVSPVFAVYLVVATVLLYLVFLGIQTRRHREFFKQPKPTNETDCFSEHDHGNIVVRTVSIHAVLLGVTMVPIVLLAKSTAVLIDHGLETLGAPQALGGFLVAVLVLSAEGLTAFQAALDNRLQRSINVCLGSSLSTIGLTIPCVLIISLVTGTSVELGLDSVESLLLSLTLLVSMVTFSSGKTNVLQGFVHLLLFATYVLLIFD
jgi:Ca2+:H+ antiporter